MAAGATPRNRFSVGLIYQSQVTCDKHRRMAGHREVRIDNHPSGAVGFDSQAFAQWRPKNPSRPENVVGWNPLIPDFHPLLINFSHTRIEHQLDTQFFQVFGSLFRKTRIKGL
ncbi:MAG: hypothetical protein KatS3mg104_1457 [Phycisphaerae bacterium]|nr:MAG: hypothetical protein KatS3mg104_1457 [Phycisphaerae bacterium]